MTSRMTSRRSLALAVGGALLAGIAASSISAYAAVPSTLTEQGRLLDQNSAPVAGTVSITFTIYDDPTATSSGDVLWTETQSVQLDDGFFSTGLGEDTKNPINPTIFSGSKPRYLGVKVGTDAEMTPRQLVRSVPYAFSANVADLAASAKSADVAKSVDFANIANIPAACASGQFLKGYSAAGVAQCAALPALSCTRRYNSSTATILYSPAAANVFCNSGEVMTGGGCGTSPAVAITSSTPQGTAASWHWACATANITQTTTVYAYAFCCTVK